MSSLAGVICLFCVCLRIDIHIYFIYVNLFDKSSDFAQFNEY